MAGSSRRWFNPSSPYSILDPSVLDSKQQSHAGSWRRHSRHQQLLLFIALSVMVLLFIISVIVNERFIDIRRPVLPSLRRENTNSIRRCTELPVSDKTSDECPGVSHRQGRDLLPKGIVQSTTDLQLRPLSSNRKKKDEGKPSTRSLLAMAVGIKQKKNVDRIVKKFLSDNSTVILFHYDGILERWNDLSWNSEVIHIAGINQTKWWFAKHFLHPDVVAPYRYIFIWDEDIGIASFHVARYLDVMEEEGLEISQPALDLRSLEIHHRITVRNRTGRVHRRVYYRGSVNCLGNSTKPPCLGWVEGMAPVFTYSSWQCVWHMIQNDLIHGWGMDMKFGYCAKGNPILKVGVIDSEYIVHQGIPFLRGPSRNKTDDHPSSDLRSEVRRQASTELETFTRRWRIAVEKDKCWADPFRED